MKAVLISLPSNDQHEITKEIFSLGRSRGNDLRIKDPFISRKHCQIIYIDNKHIIEDLNSQNGTFINGDVISSPTELKDNDTITLGSNGPIFQFRDFTSIEHAQHEHIKSALHFSEKKNKFLIKLIIILSIIMLLSISFLFRKRIYLSLLDDDVKREFIKIMMKYGEKNYPKTEEFIYKIKTYIKKYGGSKDCKIGIRRRNEYRNMIESTFKKNNIPVDLSYIAFVESNYDPKAFNRRSGAKGMWQLMPETAKQYGLKVSKKVDERTDPEKSTQAAAEYINDLLAIFGVESFTIAVAAYNAGDGFLRSSLRQIEDPRKDRNFWYLYNKNLIPAETQEYVLKILALMIYCENPDIEIVDK